jgi:hypothetical protein
MLLLLLLLLSWAWHFAIASAAPPADCNTTLPRRCSTCCHSKAMQWTALCDSFQHPFNPAATALFETMLNKFSYYCLSTIH